MNPENGFTVHLGGIWVLATEVCRGRSCVPAIQVHRSWLWADHREQVRTLSTRVAVRTAIKLHFICRNI